jgi:DNA modification methylase
MRVLPALPAGMADLVLADPPYGIGYHTRADHRPEHRRRVANDERPYIWWLAEAFRLTRAPGALVCFCRWDVQEIFRLAVLAAGYDLRTQMVWDRVIHGMGDAGACPAPRHDVMWFATRGRFQFPGRRPKSVVTAMRAHADALVHPTEKPVALMTELVTTLAPAGGTVLDPFTGSGSSGVAALRAGMNFVGVELEPAHVATARRRLEEAAPLFLGDAEGSGGEE